MIPSTTKSILITGAASGIGLATARHFHQSGWRVGLLDVNEAALAGLARDLDGAWFHPLDVTDAEACARAVSAFAGDGVLDVLFNCAGILRMGRFEAISAEQHKRIIDINVTGLVNMSLAALPALRRADAPVVINMSSASALYGVPHLASYSASKFAVRGLTEALNIEWKRLGIRVVDKSLFGHFTPPRCRWKSRQRALGTEGFGGSKVKGHSVLWRLFQRNPKGRVPFAARPRLRLFM